MERTLRNAAVSLIVLVGASLSVVACSHSYLTLPSAVPPVGDYKDVALSGSVLDVVSVETEDKNILLIEHDDFANRITGQQPQRSFGNRKLWCDALVAALSKELSQRGATVLPSAETRFTLRLPEISGRFGYKNVGFHAKAVVTSTAGWTQTYGGGASAVLVTSWQSGAERAANYTIAELVKAMLADPAFIAQIKGGKP